MFTTRQLTAHRDNLRDLDALTRDVSLADFGRSLARAANLEFDHDRALETRCERAQDALRRQHEAAGLAPRGTLVPLNLLTRGLIVGNATAGGHLAPKMTAPTLIESMRPFSGVIAAGAQVLTGMRAQEFSMPRIDGGVETAWIDENEGVTNADPTFGRVVIRPRTVAATVTFSRYLAKVSYGDRMAEILGDELGRAILHELDRVALAGTGAGQEPVGILHADGVLDVAAGTHGALPDLALLADMEEALGVASGLTPTAFFATPQARKRLRRTPRFGGESAPLWTDDNRVIGHPAFATAHLPADGTKGDGEDLSSIVLGDFRQLAVVLFGATAVDVVVNPFTLATQGLVRVTAFLDIGIGLRHPPAFARCRDVVTET